jgi:peptide/histidine transporter 3/4
MGIAVNLVTYLTGTMHLGNASSANTVTNFMGTCFMLCLLGGFLADTFIGRFVFTPMLNKNKLLCLLNMYDLCV